MSFSFPNTGLLSVNTAALFHPFAMSVQSIYMPASLAVVVGPVNAGTSYLFGIGLSFTAIANNEHEMCLFNGLSGSIVHLYPYASFPCF